MKGSRLHPLSWPFRLKLLAAVLAALMPALVPLAAALVAFDSLQSSQLDAERAAARMHETEEATRLIFEAQSAARGYVLTGQTAPLTTFEEATQALPATLGRLRDLVAGDPVQLWRTRRAAEEFETWHRDVARSVVDAWKLAAVLPRGDARRQRLFELIQTRLELGEGTQYTRAFRTQLQALERAERLRLEVAQLRGERLRSRVFWLVLAGVPAAFATGTATALLLARRATRSLHELARAANEVERGELPEPIRIQGRDELTWLARAFNRMIAMEAVRRQERATLARLDRLLQASDTIEEAAGLVGQFAPKLLEDASGALYFFDPSRSELERAASFGAGVAPESFAADRCWAIRLAALHRRDAGHEPRCGHAAADSEAAICAPLAAHGEVFGLFSCEFPPGSAPRDLANRLALAEDLAERLAPQFAALRLREDLRSQSIRDPLTGVFNRRFFDESFERELRRAERSSRPLTVLIVDLDHFKRFNDEFGHEAGDLVLREFGGLLRQVFRATDLPCRLGGEEFVVLLPDSDLDSVRHRVEELALRLRNRELQLRKQRLGRVTLSAGLASWPRHGRTPQELLRAADEALYAAKHAGRDRYLIAS
jgi:diguanylate cyclase (GGDEF)-like protein